MNEQFVKQLMSSLAAKPGCEAAHLERTVSVRINSVVYLAQLQPDQQQRVAIKVCRHQGTDRLDEEAARAEFNSLQKVHEAFKRAGSNCLVPVPLYLLEGFGAYVMSWVEGPSLTQLVRQASPLESMILAFEAAGAWLGAFHRAGPLRQGLADLTAKARHLQVMAKQPLHHPLFMRGLDRLSLTNLQMSAASLQVSWLHGDCKTDNFLQTSSGICGIDIDLGNENAVEHDLAQFLNQVDLLATGLRFWHRRVAMQAMGRAFLKGYSQHGPEIHEPFLLWMRLWSALTFWHTQVVEQRPALLKRWVLNLMFSSLVRGLLKRQPQARLDNRPTP